MQAQIPKSRPERTTVICLIFFVIALAVRLVYLYHFSTSPFFDPKATGLDPLAYDEMARSVAAGDVLGAGVLEIMPLYGYVLGALYAIFGHSLQLAYAFQALLSASSVVLLFLFVKHYSEERVAIIAAAGGVVCQTLVFHVGMLTGETLAVFLTIGMLYALSKAIEKGSFQYFLAAGVVIGFGIITRGTFAIFIVLFMVWYAFAERKHFLSKALPHCLAMLLGAVLIVVPVTLRNAVVGGDFVMVSAHDGINMYIGNNPHAHGTFQPTPEFGLHREEMLDNAKMVAERAEGKELKPSEVSSYWKKRTWAFIREHPARFVKLVGEKILAFFNAYEVSDVISMETMKRFSGLLKSGLLPFGFIAPFAILGMVLAINRKMFAPLYVFIVANLLAVIITFVNARYRLTVLPLFLIFSGVSLVWLKDNLRYRWRLLAGIAAIGLSFLVVYKPLIAGEEPAVNAFNLANAYMYMGKRQQAEQEYKQAIQAKPDFIEAMAGLGMLYWEERRADEAEQQFKRILEIKPDDVDALNQLGNISLYRDDREKALEYWQQSLKVYPDQPEVRDAIEKNKL